MVKIRLKRIGKRGQPYYRIVVADARSPRDGKFIEELGAYNPREKEWENKVTFKGEPNEEAKQKSIDKIVDWFKKGAEPTPTVYKLLAKKGIVLKPELRKETAS